MRHGRFSQTPKERYSRPQKHVPSSSFPQPPSNSSPAPNTQTNVRPTLDLKCCDSAQVTHTEHLLVLPHTPRIQPLPMCTCMHAQCVYACVYACMRVCMLVCMRSCMRACMCVGTQTALTAGSSAGVPVGISRSANCVRACERASVRACVRACVCARVYLCVCVCLCDCAYESCMYARIQQLKRPWNPSHPTAIATHESFRSFAPPSLLALSLTYWECSARTGSKQVVPASHAAKAPHSFQPDPTAGCV